MRAAPVLQALRRALSVATEPRALRRMARNAVLDVRYGGRLLAGSVPNPQADQGYHRCDNATYGMFDKIFDGVPLGADDCIVDVGCGKARIVNWLLSRHFPGRMIGVEINPALADFARRRLRRYRQVRIITGDATEVIPPEGTVFYLYNPFDRPLVRAFAERIANAPVGKGRRLLIIYVRPHHVAEFETQGCWRIQMSDMKPVSNGQVAYIERRA